MGPRFLALLALTTIGCMPPSVKAVDELLKGLETGDVDRAAAAVHPDDRELLRAGMEADTRTALEALAIPPTPIEHEMVEIADKQDDHHVVVADLELENPLPFSAERVGQAMPDMPKTRPLTMRFRSERLEDGRWAVRLDLHATLARSRFVRSFQETLEAGELENAEAMLDQVPPPPTTAQAQEEQDRLEDSLRAALKAARARKRPGAETSGAETEGPKASAP